ncbi:hypothetical protein QFC24_006430 [Naganishia onofrii]|uniref:Uncharacterized protein n=1 Tax=Naganishia onofrii TaxID=1851511 RepID=A0ACC2X3U3_9TREE|nr:hypothetical protein QFC24_006430 [Naganishia onofrii]
MEVKRQSKWGQGEKRSGKLEGRELEKANELLSGLSELESSARLGMTDRIFHRVVLYLQNMVAGEMHHKQDMRPFITTLEALFPDTNESQEESGEPSDRKRSLSPEEIALAELVEQMCVALKTWDTQALSEDASAYADTVNELGGLTWGFRVAEETGAGPVIDRSSEGGSAPSSLQLQLLEVSSNQMIKDMSSFFSNWNSKNPETLSPDTISRYAKTIEILGKMAESLNTDAENDQTDANLTIAEGSGQKRRLSTASNSLPHRRSKRSPAPSNAIPGSDEDAEGDTDESDSENLPVLRGRD